MSTQREARNYCIHGTNLRVFCSSLMAGYLDARFRLFPPETGGGESICVEFQAVLDPSQHAIARPAPDGRPFYEMPRGEACYFEETDEVYLRFEEAVRALCAPKAGWAVFSTVESEPRNLFLASHLMLTILLVEMLKRRGWYSLHAAGFSENERAILIPGTSGTGKSTLSVALLRAGFDYLSDDMVFLSQQNSDLTVRGLVEDIDVSEQTIAFFPELNFLLNRPKVQGFTKRQVCADEIYGTQLVAQARPHIIILPHISGKESSLATPMDGHEALLEIVPNVLLTEQQSCQKHLGILAELVNQAACYRLDTGRDFDRIPSLLRSLLRSAPERAYA
jgi:hypothetical protein